MQLLFTSENPNDHWVADVVYRRPNGKTFQRRMAAAARLSEERARALMLRHITPLRREIAEGAPEILEFDIRRRFQDNLPYRPGKKVQRVK